MSMMNQMPKKLDTEEKHELLELLHEYMGDNPDMPFTLLLENIRQQIGRRISDIRDREILDHLRNWKKNNG